MNVTPIRTARARAIVAGAIACALVIPGSTWVTRLQLYWEWSRPMRVEGRLPEDEAQDRAYRRLLKPLLPARGVVGANIVSRRRNGREHFTLRYALAPLRVMADREHEFVIELGPPDSPASLGRDPAFGLVAALEPDLRLYRRATP